MILDQTFLIACLKLIPGNAENSRGLIGHDDSVGLETVHKVCNQLVLQENKECCAGSFQLSSEQSRLGVAQFKCLLGEPTPSKGSGTGCEGSGYGTVFKVGYDRKGDGSAHLR